MRKGKPEPEFFHVFKNDGGTKVSAERLAREELLAIAASERPEDGEWEVVGSDGVRYRLREVWELERIEEPTQQPAAAPKRKYKKRAKVNADGPVVAVVTNGKPRVSIRDTDGKPISGSGEAVQS